MRVGIKYCGSCNPEYNHEEVEKILRKHFKIFYSEDVDVLVLINGCRRACLRDKVRLANAIFVDSPLSEGELLEMLRREEKKLNINTPKKS